MRSRSQAARQLSRNQQSNPFIHPDRSLLLASAACCCCFKSQCNCWYLHRQNGDVRSRYSLVLPCNESFTLEQSTTLVIHPWTTGHSSSLSIHPGAARCLIDTAETTRAPHLTTQDGNPSSICQDSFAILSFHGQQDAQRCLDAEMRWSNGTRALFRRANPKAALQHSTGMAAYCYIWLSVAVWGYC